MLREKVFLKIYYQHFTVKIFKIIFTYFQELMKTAGTFGKSPA